MRTIDPIHAIAARRWAIALTLSALMLVIYLGFILLVAFGAFLAAVLPVMHVSYGVGFWRRVVELLLPLRRASREHAAELPEMVESNARTIGRLQALMQMRNEWIADARRRRSEVLAAAPEGASAAGMAEAGYDGVLRHLRALESMYGPNHPDVKRARRELETAQARRDQAVKEFTDDRIGQPSVLVAKIGVLVCDTRDCTRT